jgi:hypothetical protein
MIAMNTTTFCWDCGLHAPVNVHHRCDECTRVHAIRMQLLQVFRTNDVDWLGACNEPAVDS